MTSTFRNIKRSSWPGGFPGRNTLVKLFIYVLAIKLSRYTTAGVYESVETTMLQWLVESIVPLFVLMIVILRALTIYKMDRTDAKCALVLNMLLITLYWSLQKTGTMDTLPHVAKVSALILIF